MPEMIRHGSDRVSEENLTPLAQMAVLESVKKDRTTELRPLNDADLPLLRGWLQEDHVAKWYEHPEDWLNEVENRNGAFSWIHHFIAECGGVPVGFCQFYEYCRGGETWHGSMDIDGAYSIDYLIGDTDYVGKGVGAEMIRSLVEKISACDHAKLVIVQPDEENKASRGALLSAGFVFDEQNRLFRLKLSRLEDIT